MVLWQITAFTHFQVLFCWSHLTINYRNNAFRLRNCIIKHCAHKNERKSAIHKLSTKCINFSLIVIMCVLMGSNLEENSRTKTLCGDFQLKRSRNAHFMWLWKMRFFSSFFSSSYAKWSNYEDGIKRQIEHASYSLRNVLLHIRIKCATARKGISNSEVNGTRNCEEKSLMFLMIAVSFWWKETKHLVTLYASAIFLINCIIKLHNNSFMFRVLRT